MRGLRLGLGFSAGKAIAAPAPPLPIGDISDLDAAIAGTTVSLTYTPADEATSHEYRRGTVNPPDGAWTAHVGDLSSDDMPDDATNYFQVRGKDDERLGAGSNVDSVFVPMRVPENTAIPTVSSSLWQTGETASMTDGSWTSSGSLTYARQWYADGVAIPGADGTTYDLTDNESGKVITVGVIASNAAGASVEAISDASPEVELLPIPQITDLVATFDAFDVTLAFTPVAYATEYEYVWDEASPPDAAGTIQPLSNQTVDLESLPDETVVYFQVRGKAGASVGDWSNIQSIQTQGAELVVNGDFTSNVAGWTASTSTLAWDGGGGDGKIRITGAVGGAGFGRADQTITGLTPGATYRIRIGSIAGSSPSPNWRIRQDNSSGAILVAGTTGSFAPVNTTFVAPASGTVVLQLLELDGSTSNFSTFDKVSVRKVVP